MSKSLGNFFTVRDLLDQGIPGEVIRFVFLSTHYGKPMDWTAEKAEQAEKSLRKWREQTSQVSEGYVSPAFVEFLSDDLNTSMALTYLHAISKDAETRPESLSELKGCANLLGLLTPELGAWAEAPVADLGIFAEKLSALRAAAMASKNFAPVDALKAALQEAGVEVRMTKEGVELLPAAGFDAAKLEALK